MKEEGNKLSWFSRIMGGKVPVEEVLFILLLLLLILFWPFAAILCAFMFDQSTVPALAEIARNVISFLVIAYPLYIIPLIIIASRISKANEKQYQFFLISASPLIVMLFIILIPYTHQQYLTPSELREIGHNVEGIYEVDDDHAFYNKDTIRGADVESFRLLDIGLSYALDDNHVYYQGKVVKEADPKTIAPIYSIHLLKESTLNSDLNRNFVKDAHHVFHKDTVLTGADCATFVCGWDNEEKIAFAFDKNRFYEGHSTKLIESYRSKENRR